MSLFVAGGRGQYPSLFGQTAGLPEGNDRDDFRRRFGIQRLYQRNLNLLETLKDPALALETVNDKIRDIADDGATRYQEYLKEFRQLGFGEEECQARADIMIGRDVENKIGLLQLTYPYAMGGAEAGGWDPVSAVLMKNEQIRNLPRTFAAINSTGLNVSGVKGIKKSEKQRLKKKFKRRFGRR